MSSSTGTNGERSQNLGLNDHAIYRNSAQNVASDANEVSGKGCCNCLRYGDKAIDFKACRILFKRYAVGWRQFEALSIIWLYLHFMDKAETGATLQQVAGWSGFGKWWQMRLEKRFIQLIELNALEKFPYNGGYRYLITQKGLFILRMWDQIRGEIVADIETRHAAAMIKAEQTRDNVRARLAKRDNKGRFFRSSSE